MDLDNSVFIVDRLGVLRLYSATGTLLKDQIATGLVGALVEFPPPFFGINLWMVLKGDLFELDASSGGRTLLMSGLPTGVFDIVAGPGQSFYLSDFDNDRILRISRAEPGFFTAKFRNGLPNPVTQSLYSGADDTMLVSHRGSFEQNNFGGRTNVEVGNFEDSSLRRGLLRFDIRSLGGAAQRFTSAKARLFVSDSGALGEGADVLGSGRLQLFALSDSNATWVEGTQSNAIESPQAGSASWDSKQFGGSAWAGLPGASSVGVDFSLPALAELPFGPQLQKGSVMEFNLGDFSALRRWAAATNAGMLLKTELERGLNIISFASSESPSAGLRPELVLGYEPLVTNTDLWDVSRGTVITASSGVGAGALENMFGAQAFSAEPRNAFFADGRPGGSTHFVEWRTLRPIRLRALHLQGLDDGIATGGLRGFNQFTLFARSLINDQWIPVHRSATPSPYPPDPVTGSAQFDLTADVSPVVAREFRAEFVQAPNSALSPRIVELDGFGEVIETQTLAVTDLSTWRVKAPFGNLEGTPLKSVGLTFDTTDAGWNSDLTFDDSNTAGWHEPVFRSPREALIWADDPAPFGSSPAFFRKKFLAPPDLRLALLSYFADDDAVIWINGRTVVDLVSLGTSSSMRRSSAVTYAFWAKLPPGGGGEAMGVGAEGGQGFGGVLMRSNLLSFRWTPSSPAGDAQLSATSVSIPSDQWVHVAVAIDFVAQQGRLYLNGKEATSEVRNLSNQPIVNWVPDGFFNFGLEDSIGGRVVDTASFFQGALDEVGIFDRALSQAEVTALASSGKAGHCPQEKFWLPPVARDSRPAWSVPMHPAAFWGSGGRNFRRVGSSPTLPSLSRVNL